MYYFIYADTQSGASDDPRSARASAFFQDENAANTLCREKNEKAIAAGLTTRYWVAETETVTKDEMKEVR